MPVEGGGHVICLCNHPGSAQSLGSLLILTGSCLNLPLAGRHTLHENRSLPFCCFFLKTGNWCTDCLDETCAIGSDLCIRRVGVSCRYRQNQIAEGWRWAVCFRIRLSHTRILLSLVSYFLLLNSVSLSAWYEQLQNLTAVSDEQHYIIFLFLNNHSFL